MDRLSYFFCCIALALVSCDHTYQYTYEVTNNASSKVVIALRPIRSDSAYTLSSGETEILFVTDHGVEGARGPYFEDVRFDLDQFSVMRCDSVPSTKNYLDNSSWTYNNGLYRAIIEDSEFE